MNAKSTKQYLLPNNRRLKHIRGISLRNLCLVPADSVRDHATQPDNTSAPTEGPVAKHASPRPGQPDGLEDLRNHGKESSSIGGLHPKDPKRPLRRTTLEWSMAGPAQRQTAIGCAVERHVANVFFSLHVDAAEEPTYISEVAQRTMNPSYGLFDLSAYSALITNDSRCDIKFWAQASALDDWSFLMRSVLDLRSLVYFGDEINIALEQAPSNCVLIHLIDGTYTLPCDQMHEARAHTPSLKDRSRNVETSSSYDSLMRLSTLDACLQDALATQYKLAAEIESMINEHHDDLFAPVEMDTIRDAQKRANRSIDITQKRMTALHSLKVDKREALNSRRSAMSESRHLQVRADQFISDIEEDMHKTKSQRRGILQDIFAQRRRVVTDIHAIYPVEPAAPVSRRAPHSLKPDTNTSVSPSPSRTSPSQSLLAFNIRNLPVPNSTFTSQHLTTMDLSAALGHTAHLFVLLSNALCIPLPYSINLFGSTTTIKDPISLLSTPPSQRQFPLYLPHSSRTPIPISKYTGTTASARFEYAVFLLNKNIECLASHIDTNLDDKQTIGRRPGLRLLDIRQTLPNLKYIILVVTAGSGDVPGRKTGGSRAGVNAGLTRHGLGLLQARWVHRVGEQGGDQVRSRRESDGSSRAEGEGGEAGRMADEIRKRLTVSAAADGVERWDT